MGATADCPTCPLDENGAPSGRLENGEPCFTCHGAGWVRKEPRASYGLTLVALTDGQSEAAHPPVGPDSSDSQSDRKEGNNS